MEIMLMRIFKKYAPLQIAKYVSAFFKGNFYIQGLGAFSFDGGKVIIEPFYDALKRKVGKEINMSIASFSKSY